MKRRIALVIAATIVALLSTGAAWAATESSTSTTTPRTLSTTTSRVDTSSTASTASPTAAGPQAASPTTESRDQDDGSGGGTKNPTAGECKPGWGYGDKNHCHTGPPGELHRNGGTTRTHP